MKRIGITGGIGSGKTTLAKLLAVLGYPVYNSDERARTITNTNSKILSQIRALFGDSVFNENAELNRQELARVVFADEEKLQQLNAIIHPEVAIDFEHWCNQQHHKIVFKEAAIVFEHGLEKQLDHVWVVSAPDELRIKRVIARSHIPEKEVRERMQRQLPQAVLVEKADVVILNDDNHLIIPQVIHALNQIS
jgi:dephospho-CoA kinase